jgi:hypothetical protein
VTVLDRHYSQTPRQVFWGEVHLEALVARLQARVPAAPIFEDLQIVATDRGAVAAAAGAGWIAEQQVAAANESWLGGLDSNQDKQIQNLLYCQLYDLPTR